ncbi:MAG: ogt [Phycisphaerales bacterium]|nr:ogt [Phycisphaerales bacterium]
MGKRLRSVPAAAAANPLAWLAAVLLVIAVFIAYRPAATGTFIWDDDEYVALNPNLRSAAGLSGIWLHPTRSPQYYPVTFTSFWIEYHIWGAGPRGYHEINILLHAGSALLLWRILKRLRVPGTAFAAAVFALHPVMVESVAWITERKNTLSLLFYLAAMDAYLMFVRIEEHETAERTTRWGAYTAALVFFLCALGSKTVTASLPAALLLILWCKDRLRQRDWMMLAPFFLLGIAAGWHTSWLERSEVGASGPEWSYSAVQRCLIASRALWFYTAKLLWPDRLSFIYSKWRVDPTDAVQWMFPLAVLAALAILFALRRRIGRGPLVAVLLFVGTLAPALGFVNVYPMRYTFVADHYQYHASLALIVLIVAGATTFIRRRGLNRRFPAAVAGVIAIILMTLLCLTWSQAGIYRAQRTLWADTLRKSPNSWMVWLNQGRVAAAASPPDMAVAAAAFRKALDLAPDVADPHYDMGLIHLDERNYTTAAAEFSRAIQIEPRHARGHNMLGFALAAQHRLDDAIVEYRRALAIKPNYAHAHFTLGLALREQGNYEPAATEFLAAIDLDPTSAPALRELATCRIRQANYAAALDPLRRLLQLQPSNAEAHFDLAAACALTNHPEESNDHFLRAVALKPELRARWK